MVFVNYLFQFFWINDGETHFAAMVLAAWEALADRSLRRVLVAGALLWENLAKARAAPDPCPPTGLGAMPPPEVRPKKITIF